jgi:hypothetical protein
VEHGMVWYGGMTASASSVVVFCVCVCVCARSGKKRWKVEKCTL